MNEITVLLSFLDQGDKEKRKKALPLLIKGALLEEDDSITFKEEKDFAVFATSFSALCEDRGHDIKALVLPGKNNPLYTEYLSKCHNNKVVTLYSLRDSKEDYPYFYPLIEDRDEEILKTVLSYRYYNDSPILSSLPLYIHRNTVVYRRNLFKEKTGLSLTLFEDKRFVYHLIQSYLLKEDISHEEI